MSKALEIINYENQLRDLINNFVYGELTETVDFYLNDINAVILKIRKLVHEVTKEETFFDEPTDKK